MNKASADVLLV